MVCLIQQWNKHLEELSTEARELEDAMTRPTTPKDPEVSGPSGDEGVI